MKRILSIILLLGFVGCAKSPYRVEPVKRLRDGLFSPFSRRVVPYSHLVTDGKRLVVGTRNGDIICIDAKSRDEVWRTEVQGTITTTPYLGKSKVYAGTAQGFLYALNLETGEKEWEREFSGALLGQLEVYQDRILLAGANDGSLYAMDVDSGKRYWRYSRDLPEAISIFSFAKPGLGESRAYVGFWDGTLAALDINSGKEVWSRRLPRTGRFVDIIAPLSLEEGKLFASQFYGSLHVTNREGNDLKVVSQGGSAAASVLFEDKVIVGTAEDSLMALNADTLEKVWIFQSKEQAAWSGLKVEGDRILGATYDGVLHIVDGKTGERLWSYDFHSSLQGAPVRAADQLWVLTERGGLFRLDWRGKMAPSESRK